MRMRITCVRLPAAAGRGERGGQGRVRELDPTALPRAQARAGHGSVSAGPDRPGPGLVDRHHRAPDGLRQLREYRVWRGGSVNLGGVSKSEP